MDKHKRYKIKKTIPNDGQVTHSIPSEFSLVNRETNTVKDTVMNKEHVIMLIKLLGGNINDK